MNRLALIPLLLVLGACAKAPAGHCDGWRPIALKQKTVNFIVDHDEKAAESILTHNEFGERIGCWSAGK